MNLCLAKQKRKKKILRGKEKLRLRKSIVNRKHFRYKQRDFPLSIQTQSKYIAAANT